MSALRFDIISAVPELCDSPLAHSIVGRARESGQAEVFVHNLRTFTDDPHRQIDDYPFGGGAGMVLKPEPVFACMEHIQAQTGRAPDEVIFLTPDGEMLTQSLANRLSLSGHVVLIAGHYKGLDQRVRDTLVTREISIGDYVLSGGELPAMVLVDAVVRLIPGVLGDAGSALSDSFQDGLLDAPSYTRPAEYRGMHVPDVLRSGDHARIRAWRDQQRYEKTVQRRPDLLADAGVAGESRIQEQSA